MAPGGCHLAGGSPRLQASRLKAAVSVAVRRAGTATLITKRGRPRAVLMPVEQARAAGRHLELTSLAGTGAGLWGGDSARMVREMRRPHAAGRYGR